MIFTEKVRLKIHDQNIFFITLILYRHDNHSKRSACAAHNTYLQWVDLKIKNVNFKMPVSGKIVKLKINILGGFI